MQSKQGKDGVWGGKVVRVDVGRPWGEEEEGEGEEEATR